MNKYFNVYLEFDKNKVESIIASTIENAGKGYVCAIESNNLSVANKNIKYNSTVNSSLVNICDGSNIAWILGKIHKKRFQSYIGHDIFINYIRKKTYKQYFLGNTPEVLSSLKMNLSLIDSKILDMTFETLPFCNVDEFDYIDIARKINSNNPDIIWVSLGAPKQEMFMEKLAPYLKRGVMFGIGAAFNFNSNVGSVKRAPKFMLNLRLEWLYRAFEEPKKNIPRYYNFLKLLPRLVSSELKNRYRLSAT